MNNENSNPPSIRERLKHEGREFLIIFLYLAPCLTVLLLFKQAILADYQISYLRHGYAIVEALMLSKMIVLGQACRLVEKYRENPLIYPTLYKALIFTLLVDEGTPTSSFPNSDRPHGGRLAAVRIR